MAGCGIIILGNSGAGKSFVANKILDQERFKHGISAKSITHSTDFEVMTLDGKSIVVFNIPGLIEADQKRIILNKKEIETAFEKQPNSIVMFIFGNQNGRPVNQDIVAFNAIHKAYSFKQNSLLLAVNKVPRDGRPSDYKGEILTIFQEQIEDMVIDKENLLILDEIIDIENSVETGRFREEIMQALSRLRTKKHEKTHEIQVLKDELEQMTNEIKEKQAQFDADRHNHENQIKENQIRIDEMEIKAANERALLEQQYQQKIEELTKQIKEKNEFYENSRTQAEESRKHFQEECQRDERNQEEVVKYRKLYMEFEKQCNTLTKDLDKTKKELMQLTKEKPKPESESWIKRLFALFFPCDNKS